MIHSTRTLRRSLSALAIALLATAGSCGGDGPTAPVVASRVVVTPASATIIAGKNASFTAQALDASGAVMAGSAITWSSSDTSIAVVTGGTVTARKPGAANIIAASGAVQGIAAVTVIPVPVASVTVAPTPDTIFVSRTVQIVATPGDEAGAALTGRTVTWSSSDTTVATVAATGLVTGRVAGTATVTATVEGRSGSAQIVVRPMPVASIALSPSAPSLVAGGSLTLTAVLKDADGTVLTGRAVTWASGNAAIASVDGTGKVTAVAVGSTAITATSGTASAQVTVTVLAAPVAAVVVAAPGGTTSFPSASTLQLTAVAQDSAGATLANRTITWSSSDTTAATVSSTGLVTMLKTGAVTITATSEGKSASLALTGTAAAVASVSISPAATTLFADNTTTFTVVTKDALGRTLTGRAIAWSTNDPSAVPVTAAGLVTARLPGSALVVATVEGKSAAAAVNVPYLSSIAAGSNHNCVLDASGTIRCWGNNGSYQLDLPDTTARPAPVASALNFSTLSSKRNHVCAINGSDAAFCWGQNVSGALGNGTTALQQLIQPVSGGLGWLALSASGYSCGIASGGEGYCWGTANGGVGDGTTAQQRIVPTKILGGRLLQSISVGATHACALDRSGQAFCWGAGERGQLGTGTTGSSTSPVAANTALRFVEIAAGAQYTCARTSTGTLYCWGANTNGQLGDGSTTDRLAPTAVAGGLGFSTMSLGETHACGIASNSTAYCWGSNTAGQLGTGNLSSQTVPVAVAGGRSFTALSAGGASDGHTCGITINSGVYCWGNNVPVQPNGLGTSSSTPVLVASPTS